MAYATVEDVQARRLEELSDAEADLASVLLDDAAVLIDSVATIDPEDEQALERAKTVSCNMVNRALMASTSDALGVSNASYTMGPFSQSATFSNPSGDLYLTSNERRMLGAGATAIGSMRAKVGWPHA